MNLLQAIILGIVEGVTEFLPISSTGHMILASKLMGISESEFVKSFEIIIQLGAIAAVFFMYVRKVIANKQWIPKLIVAFATTGVFGVVLYKIVKTYLLGNGTLVAWTLILGGITLLIIEKIASTRTGKKEIGEISYKEAGVVGLSQAISMVPGVSRSMATIFGGMGVGMSRSSAVEFSFLLAVPTMAAATLMDLVSVGSNYSTYEYQLLAVGLVVSFVTAWIVVSAFLRYVQNHSFNVFGWYRIAVGMIYLMIVK